MEENIVEQLIVPDNVSSVKIMPDNVSSVKVVQKEKFSLFAPKAGSDKLGMVKPSSDDFVVYNDGTMKLSERFSVNALPPISNEDEGKFLRVANGKWEAVTILNAEDLDV